jgi:type IV pilus assembly protein PilE
MNNRTLLSSRRERVQPMAGFTLVELIVTMVIAAILAAIAIPAYSNYVRKAHRVEAKNAVLNIASLEERFFSTSNTYTNDPTKLGYTGAVNAAFTVGSGYYNVLVTTHDATSSTDLSTYSITATAQNDQLKDTQCQSFVVTSQGTQTSADAASAATTSTCWQ